MQIRPIQSQDIVPITDLYNHYILNTTITFELSAIAPEEMARRVAETQQAHTWLVAEEGGRAIGYGYYGPFHPRAAYAHTVETSIYLAPTHQGRGLGKALYGALIQAAQTQGYRELVALIALPNPASIRLHEALGFREVGVLSQVGYKFGRYLDVALWQKSLGKSA